MPGGRPRGPSKWRRIRVTRLSNGQRGYSIGIPPSVGELVDPEDRYECVSQRNEYGQEVLTFLPQPPEGKQASLFELRRVRVREDELLPGEREKSYPVIQDDGSTLWSVQRKVPVMRAE